MSGEKIDELIPATKALPQTAGTRYVVAEIMEKRRYNPIEKMIDLAEKLERFDEDNDTNVHADRLFKLHSTLAKFYAPQPKSVDVSVKADNTFTIQTIDYTGMLSQRQQFIPVPANQGPTLLGVTEAVEAALDD